MSRDEAWFELFKAVLAGSVVREKDSPQDLVTKAADLATKAVTAVEGNTDLIPEEEK